MTFKDDATNTTGAILTKSQEIFEKIFAQATRELRITRKPKPAAQKPLPSASPLRTGEKQPKITKISGKTAVTYKSSEKVTAGPRQKPTSTASPRKVPGILRTSLLLILLLVLAGFAANYFAVIDLSGIPHLLGLAPKPVAQAPVPKKQTARPAQKPAVPPKPAQADVKPATDQPAPTAPAPSAASKEERLVQLETPTTVAPLKEEKHRVEERTAPALTTDQPKPAQPAAQQEPQPATVQVQVSEKPTAPVAATSKQGGPQYPYSVYLGSFKTPEAVRKALSEYQEKGLSAYWVKVDLGDKGVWHRFFAGYFRTREEAEKNIRECNLQGATPGITRYANLIGLYGSSKEVEDQKSALVSAGFYPYVIRQEDGSTLVYSGAFDRKELAEKEQAALASKGIKSEVVER